MLNTTYFKAYIKYLTPRVVMQPAGMDFTPIPSPLSVQGKIRSSYTDRPTGFLTVVLHLVRGVQTPGSLTHLPARLNGIRNGNKMKKTRGVPL